MHRTSSSSNGRVVRRAGAVFGLLLLCCAPGRSQCCGATITGRVTDAEGAVVPNAKVTITNVATGRSTKTVTNRIGDYRAVHLPLGRYKVKVGRKGFETVETPARTLEIDQTLRFDVALPAKVSAKNRD